MATHRIGIISPNTLFAANIFPGRIADHLTLTNADIGNVGVIVLPELASDFGFYGDWMVPQNYVGTPKVVVTGIFDGEPGAGDDLGFTIKGKELADDETADAAFGTEDTFQDTDIGAYADEDYFEFAITLSNIVPVVGETIYYLFARDDSATTYTGILLMSGLYFEYADA